MTVSLITELKNRIPAWLDRHHVAPQPPAAYAELESQLEALYEQLMDAYESSEKFGKPTIVAWGKQLDDLTRQIRPLRRAGKLSRNEVEALHQWAFKMEQILESMRQQPARASSEAPSKATSHQNDRPSTSSLKSRPVL